MKLPARAQRVDEPAPGAFSIELYAGGSRAFLVASPSLDPPVELLADRPRGASASPLCSQLRKHLVGATLKSVRVGRRGFALDFAGKTAQLVLIGDRREGVALHRDGRRILGSRRVEAPPEAAPLEDLSALAAPPARGFAEARANEEAERAREDLRRASARALARLERKRRAIEGDAARAAQAPALREEAEVLLIHLDRIERGADRIALDRPSGGALEIALDPRRTPAEEVEARFRRARKLERGEAIARSRLASVDEAIARARAEVAALPLAPDHEVLERARALGKPPPRKRTPGAPQRLPYRKFVSKDGLAILVGRSAADNDTLTLRVARPSDLFVHARGVTGSHVIVQTDRDVVPSETLLDAATLAVHFSAAAKEKVAEVQYAKRRYVRKGKGFAKGAVRVDRERVILLEMEETRLRRLLEGRDEARPR